MEYWIVRPLPGLENAHTPNTLGGPWHYLFDGLWKSIFKDDGKTPRPITDEGEAIFAEAYFQKRTPGAEAEPLTELVAKRGVLELEEQEAKAAPGTVKCPDCGEDVAISGLVDHIKAHVGGTVAHGPVVRSGPPDAAASHPGDARQPDTHPSDDPDTVTDARHSRQRGR